MDEDCPYFIAHISESVCRTFCGCRAGFYTLAEQEVLRLVGKLSLFFFFFYLAAVNLEVKQKKCTLNPLCFIFL